MTRKIIASVVHSATLTTDERASLLADPVIPQGYCRMQVNYPNDWVTPGWATVPANVHYFAKTQTTV